MALLSHAFPARFCSSREKNTDVSATETVKTKVQHCTHVLGVCTPPNLLSQRTRIERFVSRRLKVARSVLGSAEGSINWINWNARGVQSWASCPYRSIQEMYASAFMVGGVICNRIFRSQADTLQGNRDGIGRSLREIGRIYTDARVS